MAIMVRFDWSAVFDESFRHPNRAAFYSVQVSGTRYLSVCHLCQCPTSNGSNHVSHRCVLSVSESGNHWAGYFCILSNLDKKTAAHEAR